MLRKLIFLQRKLLAIGLAASAGTGLLYLLVVHCVMTFHPDPQSVPAVARWLVAGGGAVALFGVAMSDTYILFPMTIRMGGTRRAVVPALVTMHMGLALLIYLIAFAFAQIEWFLTYNLWVGMVDGLIVESMEAGILWWASGLMLLGGMLLGYTIGAVINHFGQRVGGFILCGFWLSFIALQNGMLFSDKSPLDYAPPLLWAGLGVALVVWIFYTMLTLSVQSE